MISLILVFLLSYRYFSILFVRFIEDPVVAEENRIRFHVMVRCKSSLRGYGMKLNPPTKVDLKNKEQKYLDDYNLTNGKHHSLDANA